MASDTKSPLKLVYCYAPEDEKWCYDITRHLGDLRRQKHITTWSKHNIGPGLNWQRERARQFATADIILLLISSYFMHSDACHEEMQQALKRQNIEEVRVIPIYLRPVDCEYAPFWELKGLPTNNKPISQWKDRESALEDIAQGIRNITAEIKSSIVERGKILALSLEDSEKRKTLETFSQNYRNSLKQDAQIAYLQIPGMRHPLTLSKTYIHLRVHKESHTHPASSAMPGEDPEGLIERDQRFLNKKVETALAPHKVIQEKTRCIIMGDPGSGKTSLLKYLTIASANKEFKDLPDLPIYIKLNEFVESTCSTLLEFAAIDWNMRCGISKAYAVAYLEEKLRAGALIMLLDALDETKIGKTAQEANNSYLRAVRAIQDLTKMSSKIPIVVTMRKTNLPDTILTGFWLFDILDLRREDIYQFVENWHKDQPDSLTQANIADIKTWWSQKSRQFLVENKIKLNCSRRSLYLPV